MVEQFYKKIANPHQVRRSVLEASKETIQNLKGYQKILDLRDKRKTEKKKLKVQIKEINMYLDRLRDALPADLLVKLEKEESKRKHPAKTTKKGKKKVSAKKPAGMSEVAKLEDALANIEEKLKTLS